MSREAAIEDMVRATLTNNREALKQALLDYESFRVSDMDIRQDGDVFIVTENGKEVEFRKETVLRYILAAKSNHAYVSAISAHLKAALSHAEVLGESI